ncbi:Hypothetical predicted protein [Mytilus galloprovincialis]|uniref:Uncharacterized protein n=1 Tax=Mytilus galloprovincialis TaxID=29158 RepID=A0A8B6BFK9_MYTGA|nr:Hypothetical predicted protein [Mytilus galloprovincialis]
MYSSSQDSSSIVLTGTLSSVDTSALTKSPLYTPMTTSASFMFTSKAISTASSTCVPSYNEDRQVLGSVVIIIVNDSQESHIVIAR